MRGIDVTAERLRLGLTPQELAAALNVHWRTISKWEAFDTDIVPMDPFATQLFAGLAALSDTASATLGKKLQAAIRMNALKTLHVLTGELSLSR